MMWNHLQDRVRASDTPSRDDEVRTSVEARETYLWFLAQKDFRKQALAAHALRLGHDLKGEPEQVVETLHDLLVEAIRHAGQRASPTSATYSLCSDVAIFMADLLIEQAPELWWGVEEVANRELSFHKPVLRGFSVGNRNYAIDFEYLLVQYARRLCCGGKRKEGLFWRIFSNALAKARGAHHE